jgi:hypothetical protein
LEPRTITIAQKVIIIGKQNGAGCFSKRRKLLVVWIWYEVELLAVSTPHIYVFALPYSPFFSSSRNSISEP